MWIESRVMYSADYATKAVSYTKKKSHRKKVRILRVGPHSGRAGLTTPEKSPPIAVLCGRCPQSTEVSVQVFQVQG